MNRILNAKKIICAVLFVIMAAAAPVDAKAEAHPFSFTVKQIYSASSYWPDETFVYILKPLAPDNPMPSESAEYTFTITGTGGVEIGPMRGERPGVYRYEIFQVIKTEQPDFIYDKRVYTVEVYADTELNIVVTNEDGTKADAIVFENGRKGSPGGINAESQIEKVVYGSPGRNSVFTFRLSARTVSQPMPAGSVNGVKMVHIIGPGQVSFGSWSYDKAGIYYYDVYEQNTGENGYVYDTAVYTITDTVKEENGRLTASRAITRDSNRPAAGIVFFNIYRPAEDRPDPSPTPAPAVTPAPVYPPLPPEPVSTPDPPDPPGIVGAYEPDPPPGVDGPKTGDDSNAVFDITLFILGGLLVFGAAAYLLTGGKRKRDGN